MGMGALMQVLRQLPEIEDRDLLVGPKQSDDAAVYRISDECAVVVTLDFFPPIVDDPYTFGEIAAANALSDVYAMGGNPRIATNIVCFPRELPLEILTGIIRGSTDKLKEAGVLLVGGHSIEDREIKYGLSVTGFINPKNIVTNSGAKAGDVLILTKPIGAGVITSALKGGRVSEEEAGDAFISMKRLNRDAKEAMTEVGVSACTDVTGFGLLGHAFEVANASGVSLVIRSKDVEFFKKAVPLAADKKNRPRAIATNMEFLKDCVEISEKVNEAVEVLLHDPQTSGGLLIAVDKNKAGLLVKKLNEKGVDAFIMGGVIDKRGCRIRVE